MTASLLPSRLPNPAPSLCRDSLHSVLPSHGLGMKKAFVLGSRGSTLFLALFLAWRKAERKPRSLSPCKVCLRRICLVFLPLWVELADESEG